MRATTSPVLASIAADIAVTREYGVLKLTGAIVLPISTPTMAIDGRAAITAPQVTTAMVRPPLRFHMVNTPRVVQPARLDARPADTAPASHMLTTLHVRAVTTHQITRVTAHKLLAATIQQAALKQLVVRVIMRAKVKAAAQPALRASTVPLVKKSPCPVLEAHTRRPTQVRVLLVPTSITAR